MKFLKFLTFSFLLTFYAPFTAAYDTAISVGNLCEFIGRIQVDDAGSSNFCNLNPFFAATFIFSPFDRPIKLEAEIATTFPRSGRDENISKMNIFTLLNARTKWTFIEPVLGAGLFITRISGGGGEVELNNGNTITSFPLPDSTTYARNFIINAGLGYRFTPSISSDLRFFIFNLLTSEDRAYSLVLNITYQLGLLP